jgi:hypothetical protein
MNVAMLKSPPSCIPHQHEHGCCILLGAVSFDMLGPKTFNSPNTTAGQKYVLNL